MTAWIDSTLVKKYAATKWDAVNYVLNSPFSGEASFAAFIDDTLIPAAQAHINAFCKRDFDVDYSGAIPEAIQDICARATANMIQYLVMNKTGPLIRVSDYKISMPEQDVLPDDLKALLAPWVVPTVQEGRTGHVKMSAYKTQEIADRWGEEVEDGET